MLQILWLEKIFHARMVEGIILINALIEDFLSYKRHNRGRTDRTIQAYGDILLRLVEYFAGRDPLLATRDELVIFSGIWLHKKGIGPVGRRPYVSAVREFFKWAHQNGHIAHNPAADLPSPNSGRKIPRLITLENAERLMWGPDFSTFEGVRDGAILSIFLGCGLRAKGLVNLNESNLSGAELNKKVRMVLKVREKGDKERMVPVPESAEMLLRVYLEHPDLKEIDRTLPNGDQVLFVSMMNRNCPPHEYIGERRRLSTWAIRDMVKKYGRVAGVPEEQLHPHAMRHLFGTELLESDVDILTRQELLGHADPKSTAIYTHLAMRKKIAASDLGNPLGKMKTPMSELIKKMNK
ncbi:MAG: tyrosine-type recombinase/integrase [Sulfuricella sp.]